MMLADTEDVEADFVAQLDFFEQMLEAVLWREFEAGGRVGDGGCETVDADFHVDRFLENAGPKRSGIMRRAAQIIR